MFDYLNLKVHKTVAPRRDITVNGGGGGVCVCGGGWKRVYET